MKKILVMLLAVVMCVALLSGCGSNTDDANVIGSSDTVEETTESSAEDTSLSAETEMADSEVIATSEEDLNTILTTYGYTIEALADLYDECILDNAKSYEISYQYINGNIDTLLTEEKYTNRITIESIMLNNADKEMSKWYDELLIDRTVGELTSDRSEKFAEIIKECGTDLTSAERTIYSYSFGIYIRGGAYIDYLDNSFSYYIDTEM